METGRSTSSSNHNAPRRSSTAPQSASSASIRKQRQALEARLLHLQQADKCLRDGALSNIPKEIAKWRDAGQMAAQDLWKMTGAEGGSWSTLGGGPSCGDYGLDSPPSSLTGAHASPSGSRKRRASASPEPPGSSQSLQRVRRGSPGAEEQAAALLSSDVRSRLGEGYDSQGAYSDTSLPELSELLRRSQSMVGASVVSQQQRHRSESQANVSNTPTAAPLGGLGSQSSWNIGSMLDMLGADKSTLGWDVEEEDFKDSSASTL